MSFVVDVTVGRPGSNEYWTAYPGVLADHTPADPVLGSPMEWSWSFPDGPWPVQPNPVELKFTLLAPEPIAALDIGAPCQSIMSLTGIGAVAELFGRITDLEAVPVTYYYPTPLGGVEVKGIEYSIVAVDYTVDLAELAPRVGFVQELAIDRINDALVQTRNPYGWRGSDLVTGVSKDPYFPTILVNEVGAELRYSVVAAKPEADDTSTRDIITEVLAQVPPNSARYGACFLAPHVGFGSDFVGVLAPSPWVLDFVLDSVGSGGDGGLFDGSSWYPGLFGLLASGKWGLDIDPATDGWVLDANLIDYDAKWKRNKASSPNRITTAVTVPPATEPTSVTVSTGDRAKDAPVVVQEMSASLLTSVADAVAMCAMYLPPTDTRDRWAADGFRFYATEDIERLFPAWFPQHGFGVEPGEVTNSQRAHAYTRPVVIHGLDENETPTGKPFHYGQLASVTLTLDGADPVVDFRLRRSLPENVTAAALTFGQVATLPGGGPTIAQLDPRFTIYDYRLARRV